MCPLLDLPTELRLDIWAQLYESIVEDRKRDGRSPNKGVKSLKPMDIQWDVYDAVYDRTEITEALFNQIGAEHLTRPLAASDTIRTEAFPYFVGAMQRLSRRPRAVINFHAEEQPPTNADEMCRSFQSLRLDERWEFRINICPIDDAHNEQLIKRIKRFQDKVLTPTIPNSTIDLCLLPPQQRLSTKSMADLLRAIRDFPTSVLHVHLGVIRLDQVSDETLRELLTSRFKKV